ncbi:hypothetical protein [Thermophilibacter sp.]
MISEDRDSFDSWVIETYRELHSTLFDLDRRFIMRYMLSGEMLCYLIVKPWYERVMNLEDIRSEVPQDCLYDVRDYLGYRCMDNQAGLVRWFVPSEESFFGEEYSEIGAIIVSLLVKYGFTERIRFLKEKRPDFNEDMFKRELARLFDSPEGLEDCIYHLMDYIDRLNESGEEIPEELRVLTRHLETTY